ncbi:acyl--CoA ligase family protein [Anaeromyxobacter paludicola]|uniref:Acyl-CoA synthetase n=1 Tax=Anaeromyxobacter paludicola TaxID=2918171 RepID=A0ABN6NA67_9BACT|nr:acyl--CoA ligase family protein [Anaeromyxobacter paludicola]BDG08895.1 acyl-CoA synthetase [Anaeromyxobacter paludicola]
MELPLFQKLWARPEPAAQPVHRALLTPLSFLEHSLHVFPDKLAVVDGARRFTYRELGERVYRLATALQRAGVRKGDRVAVLSPNATEVLEAHYGVPQLGAVLVAINVRLSPSEVVAILRHSGARVLLADPALEEQVAAARREADLSLLVWTGEGGARDPAWGEIGYERLLATGSPEPFTPAVDDEDQTISINYTSGTTGQPKGVMYTHRGAYLNALGEIVEAGLEPESVYLWTLPMFHCNGWCFTWAVTAAGARHVVVPKVEPARVFELVAGEGVTHLCGAPTVLVMIQAEAPSPDYRFPRPLRAVTAGAPPPPSVIARMESLGAVITHVYGLTETYGPHAVCKWKAEWNAEGLEQRAALKARQGVGYLTSPELRVVDEELRDVPADGETLGEIVMRGNNVTKGYFRDPEGTAVAFRGGWFHSGDLGVMHPDGYVELRDRKKDVIISGGENISTVEVEKVLYFHPAVLEAAVIGIPDEKWGEVPKAFVTLRSGREASEKELIGYCREHLAHFKCPKRVEFGPLPKTSTGKVQKFKLREKEWAGHRKRIH